MYDWEADRNFIREAALQILETVGEETSPMGLETPEEREIESLKAVLREQQRRIEDLEALLPENLTHPERFDLCPSCKGKRGVLDATSMKGTWYSCGKCNGAGWVKQQEPAP
jgi:hypothetical protein